MSTISEAAFGLIVAEGQLENAIAEERRWRLREQEAYEMREAARVTIIKWQRIIKGLQNTVADGDSLCYTRHSIAEGNHV